MLGKFGVRSKLEELWRCVTRVQPISGGIQTMPAKTRQRVPRYRRNLADVAENGTMPAIECSFLSPQRPQPNQAPKTPPPAMDAPGLPAAHHSLLHRFRRTPLPRCVAPDAFHPNAGQNATQLCVRLISAQTCNPLASQIHVTRNIGSHSDQTGSR